jgi:hypothetical protein
MNKSLLNYWQDPGFRTIWDFISFGRSINHPIYASFNSFWDSIYASFWADSELSGVGRTTVPPWNYNFLLAGTIFGIVPTALIVIGCVRVFLKPRADEKLFSLALIVIYNVVFLRLFMSIAMRGAKALYLSCIIICYVTMFAYGADMVTRNRLVAHLFYSFMACWFINVYAAYFVL